MMGDDATIDPCYATEIQAMSIAQVFGISPAEVLDWDYELYLLAVEYIHHYNYAQKHGGKLNGRSKIKGNLGGIE